MKCNNCGNEITDNKNNCPNCGALVQNNEKENKPKKSSFLAPIIILIVAILAILSGVVLFIYEEKFAKEPEQEETSNNGTEGNQNGTEKNYTVGQELTLVDGSSWYFLSADGTTITLLSKDNYKTPSYYGGDGTFEYETSGLKNIIDTQFIPEITASLTTAQGNVTNLSARLLTIEEIAAITNSNPPYEDIELSSEYEWLYKAGTSWTMSVFNDGTDISAYIITSWVSFGTVDTDVASLGLSGNQFNIRPVLVTSIDNIKAN